MNKSDATSERMIQRFIALSFNPNDSTYETPDTHLPRKLFFDRCLAVDERDRHQQLLSLRTGTDDRLGLAGFHAYAPESVDLIPAVGRGGDLLRGDRAEPELR